jgi:hypothetical protein
VQVVGLKRSSLRRLPVGQTPDDPDAVLREGLRCYAMKNPNHGFRRAWAALRSEEGGGVNKNGPEFIFRCLAGVLRQPGGDLLYSARSAAEQRLSSSRSTDGCGRSASTATTGPACWKHGS